MADKNSYPQIPATVWWGLRGILQRTPTVTIDDRFLGVQLGVQEVAARQYLSELKRVGILTEEGKATAVALRWRNNETYSAAVQEILASVYPEGLLHVAPPVDQNRQKAIAWFTHEGLGSGTAGNKAATYLMMGSRTPSDSPSKGASAQKGSPEASKVAKAKPSKQIKSTDGAPGARQFDLMPLNVNVQIHISADATGEQIESIFSAMRRYLYDKPIS
ncbi:conserved hypothetical protein [Bradyrhizobium sp. ORS 375]|uniref:hypothetical protein n=1 Tax=Bradyrhizobium sp. (strain ORS 375) TaxID=566679 RepID=UPI00024059D8|nr:hypothetical protein [Bradyrhizobium sp. ORS 375]CCD96607.1 conserved hypothetical protein [Bradyrhizobium sp. ORS 375]